jgi:hypothetical protein
MANLYYYFNNQTSFYYSADGSQILGGDVIQITMPTNNSNQTIFSLVDGKDTHYYTLNSMYIALSFDPKLGMYQLILQGNKNDFTNNTTQQILLMIPILTKASDTINGATSPITQINNIYIGSILKNMEFEGTYNFSYGENEDSVDMNKMLTGNSEAAYYPNVIDANVKSNIIVFNRSNIYVVLPEIALMNTLTRRPLVSKLNVPIKKITVESNGMQISSTTETDIYIDCSPTNSIGEKVDIYTSKDLDQLEFFKINDLKVWAFRFVTIFIILLIIFVIIKLFQVSINGQTKTTISPSLAPTSR